MLKKFFFCYLVFLIALHLTGCNDSSDSSPGGNSTTSGHFNLSGRILVASNIAKDNDVNDVNAPVLPNNNASFSAQGIPNPVILGGYVNQAGAGPDGRSKSTGDLSDYFEVDLRAGQSITLFVANQDLRSNDLDLALRDNNGVILNASIGDGKTEVLTVPRNGHFFVEVHASLGASNYLLSIGQNISATSTNGMSLSDDFMPGEVIVQQKNDAQQAIDTFGMKTNSIDTGRRQLFTLADNQYRSFAADDLPSRWGNLNFASSELNKKYDTLMAIKTLRRNNNFSEVSPNYKLYTFQVPNDSFYHFQWNHTMMNLPSAWDVTTGNPSVIVAVVDTGVLLNHPDLRGNLVPGYDFISRTNISIDGDGRDPNPDDPGDQSPGGSSFHGTHVAGTIAALTNNNEGVAGIGWQTKVMPLRVLGKGGEGLDFDIEQAIRYAAGLVNDSGRLPAKRADVINLSLGGPSISSGFKKIISEIRKSGIIVTAASGNEDTDKPMFPASLDGVISVGAVDINKGRATYSNFGPYLDVVAPGGDNTPDINGDGMPDRILSTIGEEIGFPKKIKFSYRALEGTSMAAPHIAGVISLMKAVNPGLTPDNVDNLLISGKITEDLGVIGRDNKYGYGLINAQKAVLAAIEVGGGTVPQTSPLLVVSPKSLNFGLTSTSATLTLSNGGGGNLQIQNISDDSGGFLSWAGNGLGDYIIQVNRSRLTIGTYTATITIKSNVNIVKVPVILQVGDANIAGDAGFHYILLVNSDTLKTVQHVQATAINGVYNFNFNNVPAGKYLVVAGTDFNNNNIICEVGEACGKFPTVERPSVLVVTGNRTGIDFSTGFNVNFLSKGVSNFKRPKTFPHIK